MENKKEKVLDLNKSLKIHYINEDYKDLLCEGYGLFKDNCKKHL